MPVLIPLEDSTFGHDCNVLDRVLYLELMLIFAELDICLFIFIAKPSNRS